MKPLSLVIAAVSLAIVVAIVAYEWTYMTSPGALHASHFSVPELQGSTGCAACHGAPGQAMADACTACHQEIAVQVAARRGIHGGIDSVTVRSCSSCHSEHTGGKVCLVNDQSFAKAGVSPVETYDHRYVPGFCLAGAHSRMSCEQCHIGAHATSLAKGEKRFLGLSQECASCHQDVHQGEFGNDCVSCHGQTHAFKEAADFTHTPAFPLENAHARSRCAACHASGAHSVASLRAVAQPVRECVSCHDDAHKGALGNDCASCHGTTLPFDQAERFRHTTLFPLTGAHSGLACKDCHAPTGLHSVAALQAAPRTPRLCAECHDSPHGSALIQLAAETSGLLPGAACRTCHSVDSQSFSGRAAQMSRHLHTATGFPLDPPHDKVDCAACHTGYAETQSAPGQSPAARFAAAYPGRSPTDCAACHQDPHRGQFDGGSTGGRCIECHKSTHFSPSAFDHAHHARTRFPLTGMHQAVACIMCHKEVEGARRFVPTGTACVDCHADVHLGRFDAPGRPASIDGRQGCARCHEPSGFGQVAWKGRDHSIWTGYELTGAHAAATCSQCHTRPPNPSQGRRTLGFAPRNCTECHSDPHGGQFAQAGVTDCARCHTETQPFVRPTFDHNRDATFKLDDIHVKLDCASCHRPARDASGATFTRYRPIGARCQDCHDAGMLRAKEGVR